MTQKRYKWRSNAINHFGAALFVLAILLAIAMIAIGVVAMSSEPAGL